MQPVHVRIGPEDEDRVVRHRYLLRLSRSGWAIHATCPIGLLRSKSHDSLSPNAHVHDSGIPDDVECLRGLAVVEYRSMVNGRLTLSECSEMLSLPSR